jgi:hypothetical protein
LRRRRLKAKVGFFVFIWFLVGAGRVLAIQKFSNPKAAPPCMGWKNSNPFQQPKKTKSERIGAGLQVFPIPTYNNPHTYPFLI